MLHCLRPQNVNKLRLIDNRFQYTSSMRFSVGEDLETNYFLKMADGRTLKNFLTRSLESI